MIFETQKQKLERTLDFLEERRETLGKINCPVQQATQWGETLPQDLKDDYCADCKMHQQYCPVYNSN